ncbi:MAG: right-handed parallel beta-helix repeat-containing protein [Phycisphaerales bacterium]|nr:right-handed parallel beta-helix repeat-containing protein [Phycisphaerales bacterium]
MRKIRNHLAACAALAMGAATCADTITVCLTGTCDHTSIQNAIDSATHGDVIYIAPGTYFPSTTINTRGKAIQLLGQTSANGSRVIIDGLNQIRVLACTSGETQYTRIENMVIQNGLAIGSFPDDLGGGMLIDGSSPLVKNCLFKKNIAGNGGGVCVYRYSEPTFEGCEFAENQALNLGGGILNIANSKPQVTDCFIRENTARYEAGGINNYYDCRTFLKDSTICSNTSDTTTDQISGDYTPEGVNDIWLSCDVPEDLDGDGFVAGSDLIKLLGSWDSQDPIADINNDGNVDAGDLNCLLGSWNTSP